MVCISDYLLGCGRPWCPPPLLSFSLHGSQHGSQQGSQHGLHDGLAHGSHSSSSSDTSPQFSSVSDGRICFGNSAGNVVQIAFCCDSSETNPVESTQSCTGTTIFFSQLTQIAMIKLPVTVPFGSTHRSLP